MANTFTQIHLQFVFAVKHRDGLIQTAWKDELYKYITGIIHNHEHKLLAINGMPDHIHILVGMRPTQSVSDLMQDVKGNSSKWINDNCFVRGRFEWQEGYGAFSYGISQLPKVVEYIANQEEHHRRKTFMEEYKEFLAIFKVEFDERYIFKEPV
jgi:REP element-mobilizing transposase RayT